MMGLKAVFGAETPIFNLETQFRPESKVDFRGKMVC